MKLPNGDVAVIEIEKIKDYCLSPVHPRGKHKARVFQAVLGLAAIDAEVLRAALVKAACEADATIGASDSYGIRYIIDFELKHKGQAAKIRSCWIVRSGEDKPRFVTCFIL